MFKKIWQSITSIFSSKEQLPEGDYLDIDVSWGGYYAATSEGSDEISIFRILDFNRQSYQIAIFQEKFTSIPSFEEVASLSPFIGHAPLTTSALLNHNKVVLLGHKALTESDLAGYKYYLEEMGAADDAIQELFKTVLTLTQEPTLKLRLYAEGEELKLQPLA